MSLYYISLEILLCLLVFFYIFIILAFYQKGVIILKLDINKKCKADKKKYGIYVDKMLSYLIKKGYTCISLQQLIDAINYESPLTSKLYLFTFDEEMLENLPSIYPVLEKYNAKAAIFISSKIFTRYDAADKNTIVSYLNSPLVELGITSAYDKSFEQRSLENIETDICNTLHSFYMDKLPIVLAFAYPAGIVPKDRIKEEKIINLFKWAGIKIAFGDNSRLNQSLTTDRYRLSRMNIRCGDPFFKFKLKRGYIVN